MIFIGKISHLSSTRDGLTDDQVKQRLEKVTFNTHTLSTRILMLF